jgi:small subunit ribosomal protein S1
MSNTIDSSKEQTSPTQATAQSTGENPSPEAGQTTQGVLTASQEDFFTCNIGTKTPALVPAEDIQNAEGEPTLPLNEPAQFMVLASGEDHIILSHSMASRKKAGMRLLRALKKNKIPVQGRISGMNKGGYNIQFLGRKAFCPFSTIDITFPDSPQELMGKEFDFVIARIENRGDNIVLTRIPLLQGDIEETLKKVEAAMEAREPINGTVTRVTHFGAFVDLGGVEGLVHISELTWDRDEKTESVVKEGENISVMVLKVQRNEELHESRISLSLKRLSSNPWEEALEKYSVGDEVEAPVSRIVGFGAFIKLMPGVEALIRTEEMGWTHVRKPSRQVSRGEIIRARIIHIDEENHKIDCSMKDFVDNPWKDIEERFAPGTSCEGTVSGVQDYGYFVDLSEGITGLLRSQRIGSDIKTPLEKGDTITVTVEDVDPDEYRIALSCGDVPPPQEKRRRPAAQGKSPRKKSAPTSTDFGDALLSALKSKN